MSSHASLIQTVTNFFNGQDVFVVGGSVRDRLLGRPVNDLDLVLQENSESAAHQLAAKLGGKAFVLDAERGVIRIAHPSGFQFDLAKIQGKDFLADFDRRDFTINALAVPLPAWGTSSWKKRIVDRRGGIKDLAAHQIRMISKNIFDEDPLRLLRAFRIGADLGFSIEKNTLKVIASKKAKIKKPAPERIRDEMMKLFSISRCYPSVVEMEKAGLLDYLLPEATTMRKTGRSYYGKGGVLKHTLDSLHMLEEILVSLSGWFPRSARHIREYLKEMASGFPRFALLKWAILLHDIGKPKTAKKIDGRLRFFEHEHVGADKISKVAPQFRWSSEETSRYSTLVRNHMRPGNLATQPHVSDKAIHRFFRDLGDDAIGMLLVSLGDHLSYLTPRQRKARSSPHEIITQKMVHAYYFKRSQVLPERLLTGHDVMKTFNLKPSKLIGALLEETMEAQSEGVVKTKEDALSFLKARLPELQSRYEK